jgi:hypothetical protein
MSISFDLQTNKKAPRFLEAFCFLWRFTLSFQNLRMINDHGEDNADDGAF